MFHSVVGLPAEIHVELRRGLPAVTVPLPSRRELCQFTLRPVTNTVGDLTNMLKAEDQGVDRVVVSSSEGVRIASSNTIESLMEEDFRLTVNDRVFTVKVPPHRKLTKVRAPPVYPIPAPKSLQLFILCSGGFRPPCALVEGL